MLGMCGYVILKPFRDLSKMDNLIESLVSEIFLNNKLFEFHKQKCKKRHKKRQLKSTLLKLTYVWLAKHSLSDKLTYALLARQALNDRG